MTKIEFESGQRILFIGDSITDAGRREQAYAPLGNGYVHYAANLLLARRPERELNIQNRGISGDTTREMRDRWQQDCLDLRPDILSVMIGINDLWRGFKPIQDKSRTPVPPKEYEENLRGMLAAAVREGVGRVILMEPFYFCRDSADPMYRGLGEYLAIVRGLAEDFGAVLVPLQQAYEQTKDRVPESKWADDRVHPAAWAHAWIALQWLAAAEVAGAEGGWV